MIYSHTTGNPGLGIPLSLADFDCPPGEVAPPGWLPQDKWDDILAVSVLPGPLDSLCVNMAVNSDEWRVWYHSDLPENEPMPFRDQTGEDGRLTFHKFD